MQEVSLNSAQNPLIYNIIWDFIWTQQKGEGAPSPLSWFLTETRELYFALFMSTWENDSEDPWRQ